MNRYQTDWLENQANVLLFAISLPISCFFSYYLVMVLTPYLPTLEEILTSVPLIPVHIHIGLAAAGELVISSAYVLVSERIRAANKRKREIKSLQRTVRLLSQKINQMEQEKE